MVYNMQILGMKRTHYWSSTQVSSTYTWRVSSNTGIKTHWQPEDSSYGNVYCIKR